MPNVVHLPSPRPTDPTQQARAALQNGLPPAAPDNTLLQAVRDHLAVIQHKIATLEDEMAGLRERQVLMAEQITTLQREAIPLHEWIRLTQGEPEPVPTPAHEALPSTGTAQQRIREVLRQQEVMTADELHTQLPDMKLTTLKRTLLLMLTAHTLDKDDTTYPPRYTLTPP